MQDFGHLKQQLGSQSDQLAEFQKMTAELSESQRWQEEDGEDQCVHVPSCELYSRLWFPGGSVGSSTKGPFTVWIIYGGVWCWAKWL